ncbi:MAG: hypothetical protein CMF50_03120 [Legionellales bacterium]|nr:hypothetical protein [Legionellales bacterium]|tara:strand:+ start:2320 stop:2760 length:441 start_codon:yes stop_codon:yes gene_type:complete
MTHLFSKTLYLFASAVFIGHVVLTLLWKLRADSSLDVAVIRQAQRQFSGAEFIAVLGSLIVLFAASVSLNTGVDSFVHYTGLLVIAGILWLVLLTPLQVRQVNRVLGTKDTNTLPQHYWRDSIIWIIGTLVVIGLSSFDTLKVLWR